MNLTVEQKRIAIDAALARNSTNGTGYSSEEIYAAVEAVLAMRTGAVYQVTEEDALKFCKDDDASSPFNIRAALQLFCLDHHLTSEPTDASQRVADLEHLHTQAEQELTNKTWEARRLQERVAELEAELADMHKRHHEMCGASRKFFLERNEARVQADRLKREAELLAELRTEDSARVSALTEAWSMVALDIAAMGSTEGMNRLMHACALTFPTDWEPEPRPTVAKPMTPELKALVDAVDFLIMEPGKDFGAAMQHLSSKYQAFRETQDREGA